MLSTDATRARTWLETALQRERAVVATLLVAIPLLSWTWIVLLSQDMNGAMDGPSAWMMTTRWDAAHVILLFAMWAVMMTAMMLPSAAPLVLLYAGALRSGNARSAARNTYAMSAGYIVVWALFSMVATALQRLLSVALLLDPMMEPATPMLTAALLGLAGVYQLTPLKNACLRVCRSPLGYLLQHWRTDTWGAFTLGVRHGAYCLGCCWALMLMLFAGGVMNLATIVALTAWVVVEKFAPFGDRTAKASGVVLLALAFWMTVR